MALNLQAKRHVDLTGGESVYCINQSQQVKAKALFDSASPTSDLKQLYQQVQGTLSRNEQATLAFMLLEELRR